MTLYLRNIRDAISGVILSVLPDYAAGGVWMTTHVTRVPEEKLKSPMAVIELDSAVSDEAGEWGIANTCYLLSPVLYVVKKQTWDGMEIAEDLEILRDTFAARGMLASNGVNVAQILSVGNMEWGEGLEANQFLDTKNSSLRAGAITLNLQIGEPLNG